MINVNEAEGSLTQTGNCSPWNFTLHLLSTLLDSRILHS